MSVFRQQAARPVLSGTAAWRPWILFGPGKAGAWYDPSDLSTMWQDSAGTVAAAVDQPVGRINDKSGNGNHATQATAGKRPILRLASGLYYLESDGVDDELTIPQVDYLTSTIAAAGQVFATDSFQGLLTINKQVLYVRGSTDVWGCHNGVEIPSSYSATTSKLVMVAVTRAANDVDLHTNNFPVETKTNGTEFGSRGTTLLSGSGLQYAKATLYGAVFRQGVLTAGEIADLKQYLADKGGIGL